MAKLSGLISSGKIGQADQKTIDAMPSAPTAVVRKRKTATADAMPYYGISEKCEVKNPTAASYNGAHDEMPYYGISSSEARELDISLINQSPFQVRSVEDEEYIETLMASISQSGIISPIVVRVVGSDNSFEVIAGHHRLEACRRLGMSKVSASIRTMTDAEAACALASDNFVRKELSDYVRYKHAKMLKDNGFCKTQAEIGGVLGISRQLVGYLFSFDDFPEEAKKILDNNQDVIGANIAVEIRDLAVSSPEVFIDAIALLAQGGLRQNQVKHWIESQLESPILRMKNRQEVKIQRPGLRSAIKITYTDREAKIQAKGLNMDKLKALIENNLEQLLLD